MSDPILSVRDLRVSFPSPTGEVEAVRGISFDIGAEKVGLIGESGSGKSLTGRSIMRLLPGAARMQAGAIRFAGRNLPDLSEAQMRQLRGSEIALILQDPKFSLNPIMSVGEQIAEACRLHLQLGKQEARARTLALLEKVQIRDPERVYRLFPHEISGGMGQRVMIAMMVVARPSFIIADEPTSALDVSVRGQILNLLDELQHERPTGLLFITHDLNLVRRFCDRVLIMYAGMVVEEIAAARLDEASHPYTRGLLEAIPRLDAPRERLATLQRDPAWLAEAGA